MKLVSTFMYIWTQIGKVLHYFYYIPINSHIYIFFSRSASLINQFCLICTSMQCYCFGCWFHITVNFFSWWNRPEYNDHIISIGHDLRWFICYCITLTLICLITYFSTKLKWNRASPSPNLALALWQYLKSINLLCL